MKQYLCFVFIGHGFRRVCDCVSVIDSSVVIDAIRISIDMTVAGDADLPRYGQEPPDRQALATRRQSSGTHLGQPVRRPARAASRTEARRIAWIHRFA